MKEQRLSHVKRETTEMQHLNPKGHAWYMKTGSIYSVAMTCEAQVMATGELRVLDR
jgi:hypothetical protein